MSKISLISREERNKFGFYLSNLVSEAKSISELTKVFDGLDLKLLTDYSHGDLDKPRFCCITAQSKKDSGIIYVLSRGFS